MCRSNLQRAFRLALQASALKKDCPNHSLLDACPACGTFHYAYHSCNDRHCPQCGPTEAEREAWQPPAADFEPPEPLRPAPPEGTCLSPLSAADAPDRFLAARPRAPPLCSTFL